MIITMFNPVFSVYGSVVTGSSLGVSFSCSVGIFQPVLFFNGSTPPKLTKIDESSRDWEK